MKVRAHVPSVKNATNFNVVSATKTEVGSTLDNLKAAIAGETGAHNKYMAFAKAAKEQGYDQIARLFEATAAAELIHIDLEYNLVAQMEPGYEKPVVDAPAAEACDLNLISGAYGEMYETSDMYPAYIKKAQEEGNTKAVGVVHAGEACRIRACRTVSGRVQRPRRPGRRHVPSLPYLRLHPQGRGFRQVPDLFPRQGQLHGILGSL